MNTHDDNLIAAAATFAYRLLPPDGGYAYSMPFDEHAMLCAVDAWLLSLPSPSNPPLSVRRAIVHKFLNDLPTARRILAELGYNDTGGHWFFTHAGMYHGVEPDGFIHT